MFVNIQCWCRPPFQLTARRVRVPNIATMQLRRLEDSSRDDVEATSHLTAVKRLEITGLGARMVDRAGATTATGAVLRRPRQPERQQSGPFSSLRCSSAIRTTA